jgi:EmrB/QacA subfamily drug resistance transporter
MTVTAGATAPGPARRATPTAMADMAPAPRTKREIYTVMSGLLIAMLLAMLDNLIVGTALPTIVGELGGLEHLSWVVTAYTLATAVSTPLWAKFGDLFGRKYVFMTSIAVFMVGSALSGLSQDMGQLISFRAIQGLGAGGLMVSAMAIIADLVPPRERGRYQGLMAAVMPLAFIGGPLLGGFLTDHASWRWAFYINLPLGAIALVVIALTMNLPRHRRDRVSIDWLGAFLLAAGVAALTLFTSWGGSQYDWNSWQIILLGVGAVVALVAFVVVEPWIARRGGEPILSLALFRNGNFSAAIVVTFLVGFAMFGAVTFLPQYQQNVQGASATNSGLLLLPMMAGALVTSLAGGQFVTRTGHYKILLILGSIVMAAGLGLFATMGTDTSQFVTSLYMVVLGIGMGLLMQTSMLVVQNSVGMRDVGAASGAATLFRTVGGSLGVSLLGTLYTSRLTGELSDRLGATAGAQVTGSGQLTPAMLGRLPEAIRTAYQAAITSGVGVVFMWAGIIALLAVIGAVLIREVPLRSSAVPAPARPDPVRTRVLPAVVLSVLADRIERSRAGDNPNLVTAAARLVPGGGDSDTERAHAAARLVLRPLARHLLLSAGSGAPHSAAAPVPAVQIPAVSASGAPVPALAASNGKAQL